MNVEAIRWVIEIAVLPLLVFLVKKVYDLGNRVIALETKMDVFWHRVSEKAGSFLHSPNNHHGMDWFIERNQHGMLTAEELAEFRRLLEINANKAENDKLQRYFCSVLKLALDMRFSEPTKRKHFWKLRRVH